MAINITFDNLDSDLKFEALNSIEGADSYYDREVLLSNVFYIEDIITILFHNPRGIIKYNDAPFKMSDLNDGAEYVTKWFQRHGHKLHLDVTVEDHNVTIKSNNWKCTLKVMQTYKDDNKVKYLTEDRNDVFIKDPDDVTGVVEWTETECAWQDFVKAFEHKSEDYCELCHLDKDICTTCLVKHFQAMLNK